jgi:cleavage and polyadenylation specificity factor subunit 3
MFLEAQFGPAMAPITRPKDAGAGGASGAESERGGEETAEGPREDVEEAELQRLHGIGIPVPGIEIRVDNHVARVWLETLEVECSFAALRDRVKAVVERAVETVAPLWDGRGRM